MKEFQGILNREYRTCLYIMRSDGKASAPTRTPRSPRKFKENKVLAGQRFRQAREACWLTPEQAAKEFHVTERTLHNWESGRTRIPYTAYKLMRVLRGCELPVLAGPHGQAWNGWHFQAGKLISPEGHAFIGADSSWWHLTLLKARFWREERAQRVAERAAMGKALATVAAGAAATAAAVAGAVSGRSPDGSRSGPPPLGLVSNETSQTRPVETAQSCGFPGSWMGPFWGQNGATIAKFEVGHAEQVQPAIATGIAGSGGGCRQGAGHQLECFHGAGVAELDGLPNTTLAGDRLPTSAATGGPAPAASDAHHAIRHASRTDTAQGGQERTLPLRIGPQVQGLLRPSMTVGGAS